MFLDELLVCRDRLISEQAFFKIGPIDKVVIAVSELSHLVVEVTSDQPGDLPCKLTGTSLIALNCSPPRVELLWRNFNGFRSCLSRHFTRIISFSDSGHRGFLLLTGHNGIQRQGKLVKAQVFRLTLWLLGGDALETIIGGPFTLRFAIGCRRLRILRKSNGKHNQLESQSEQQRGA